MDFPVEDPEPLNERIEAAVQLQPKGTKEITISYGRKEKNGPVHCFVEFFAEEITPDGEQVITSEMRENTYTENA